MEEISGPGKDSLHRSSFLGKKQKLAGSEWCVH